MKNLFTQIRGILIVSTLLILFSCTSGFDEEDLQGAWKGEDFQFVQSEGPNLVAMIDGGRELHTQSELILNADGTYEIRVNDTIINGEGNWSLKDGGIFETNDGNETVEYEVLELSDDSLITKHEVDYDTPMGKIAGTITLSYKRNN